MGLDDLFSTESAFVAAATAAVFSPRTRETLRRGAVLGVSGALKAGDAVGGVARGAVRGVRNGTGSGGSSRSRAGSSSSSRGTSSGSGRRGSRSSSRRGGGRSSSSSS